MELLHKQLESSKKKLMVRIVAENKKKVDLCYKIMGIVALSNGVKDYAYR
jgi:hypothetical protein